MLADETMNHKPLIISGSNEFVKKVLDTAIFANLPISFADKRIQNEFRRQKEKKDIKRRNFIAKGGKIFTERANFKSITSTVKTRKLTDITQRGFCLPTLPKLNLVHSESEKSDVLSQNDESRKLDKLSKRINNNVRWDFSIQFLNLEKQTTQQILKNIEEKLDNTFMLNLTWNTLTVKKRLRIVAVVFSIPTNYPNGLKTIRKNFLRWRINMKE